MFAVDTADMECQSHPLSTRLGHWINALIVASLLITGFSIFSRDRDFARIVHLVPASFWNLLHFTGSSHLTKSLHEWIGLALAVNGLLYLALSFRNGWWRSVIPYNATQRAAYVIVLTIAGAMVLTGISLWFKHQIPWLIHAIGGQKIVLPIHIVLATSLLAFIALHVAQVLRTGWSVLYSMTFAPLDQSG